MPSLTHGLGFGFLKKADMSCFGLNTIHENSLVKFNWNNNGRLTLLEASVAWLKLRQKLVTRGLWHLADKSKNGVTSNPRASQSASFAIRHRLKLNYYANNVQHAWQVPLSQIFMQKFRLWLLIWPITEGTSYLPPTWIILHIKFYSYGNNLLFSYFFLQNYFTCLLDVVVSSSKASLPLIHRVHSKGISVIRKLAWLWLLTHCRHVITSRSFSR